MLFSILAFHIQYFTKDSLEKKSQKYCNIFAFQIQYFMWPAKVCSCPHNASSLWL